MAIISSLRRSFQGKVVLWVRVPPANNGAMVAASPATAVLSFSLSFSFPFPLPFKIFFSTDVHQIESYYCISFGSGNTVEYSVLGLCTVPPCSRANTATLKLNIPLYYLPMQSCNNIYGSGHLYKGQFQYPQGVYYILFSPHHHH